MFAAEAGQVTACMKAGFFYADNTDPI